MSEPFESDGQIFVPKRLDPDALPKRAFRFDVPSPKSINIARTLARISPEDARAELARVAQAALAALDLTPAQRRKLNALHAAPWNPTIDNERVDVRERAAQQLENEIEGLPGARLFARYRPLLRQCLEAFCCAAVPGSVSVAPVA